MYLGFPDTILGSLKEESLNAGYEWKVVTDDQHIEICGLPILDSYEMWKSNIVRNAVESLQEEKVTVSRKSQFSLKKIFCIYREFYDLVLYLCRLTCKFHRNFKFGLGDKLRVECVEYLTELQYIIQSKADFQEVTFSKFLITLQIRLRLLMDLKQISEKQWIFVNQAIIKLQGLIGQIPVNQGLPESSLLESSNPLAVKSE